MTDYTEIQLGVKSEDVSRSFLIVSRAIEMMAVNPTERQKRMIERFAAAIAVEQTMDDKRSKYQGVNYNHNMQRYEVYKYVNRVRSLLHASDSDQECWEALKAHKFSKSKLL